MENRKYTPLMKRYKTMIYWGYDTVDFYDCQKFTSVQLHSRVQLFATIWTAANQASLSITNSQSLFKSCPLSRWCHPTISSSVVPFSSNLQFFPAWESFQMSQFFASGGQSIGVSASASVPSMSIQDWFTDWLDLLAVQGTLKSLLQHHSSKALIFGAQLSLESNSHIRTWLLEKA